MTNQFSYKDIATIPNYHVEHFIGQINTFFKAHYNIYAGRGCKWSKVRLFEQVLKENHFNDANVELITAFIKHINELRRETNTINISINSDDLLDQNQRSIYHQAIQQLVEELPLLKQLLPKTNRQQQRS